MSLRPEEAPTSGRPHPRSGDSDILAGAALLLVAVGALAAGRGLAWGTVTRPGPGFFPRALAMLLAALALALLARGLRQPGAGLGSRWAEPAGRRRVGLLTASLLGYVAAVETAGYLLTTAALFAVMVRALSGRGWLATIVTSLVGSGGSYLVFGRLLRVQLPAGPWIP